MPGHPPVQREPLIQHGKLGIPGEGAIVRVAYRYDPARPADPAHFSQRADWLGNVLEHLVRVHNVKGAIGEGERVHIPHGEIGVLRGALGRECQYFG